MLIPPSSHISVTASRHKWRRVSSLAVLGCLLAAHSVAEDSGPVQVPPAPTSAPTPAVAPIEAANDFPGGPHRRKFIGIGIESGDGSDHLDFKGTVVGWDSHTDRFYPDGGFIQRSSWGFDLRLGSLGKTYQDDCTGLSAQANLEMGYDWTRTRRGWGPFIMAGGYGTFDGYLATTDKEMEVIPGDSSDKGRMRTLHDGRYALQADLGVRFSGLGELLVSSHTELVHAARYHRDRADIPNPDDPTATINSAVTADRAVGQGVETGLQVTWLIGNRTWLAGYTRLSAQALTTVSGKPEDGKESVFKVQIDCQALSFIAVRVYASRVSHAQLGDEAAALYRANSVTDTRIGAGVGIGW